MLLEKIKKISAKKHISIRELEARAGLGNGTVRGWGKSNPTIDNLKKVADILECTIDELLN